MVHIDSLTLTIEEAEELVLVLRYSIDEEVVADHVTSKDDPEFIEPMRRRERILENLQVLIARTRRRLGAP
jgi:hypothetical protein